MQNDFILSVAQTQQEIAILKHQWRQLDEKTADPFAFFQSALWCNVWLELENRLGRSKKSAAPFIISVWHNEKLVFVLPLMQKSIVGLGSKLSFLTGSLAQYGGCVVDPEIDQQLLKVFLAKNLPSLYKNNNLSALSLEFVAEESPLLELLGISEAQKNAVNLTTAHASNQHTSVIDFSDIPTDKSFVSTRSKNLRKNLSRRERKLLEQGELSFTCKPGTKEDLDQLLPQMALWKKQWFENRGIVSITADSESFLQFLSKMAEVGLEAKSAEVLISVLKLNNTPIAAEYGIKVGGHYLAYYSAFDENHATNSPGSILLMRIVDWLRENGSTRYDFLPQPAVYKDDFCTRKPPVYSYHLALKTGLSAPRSHLLINGRSYAKKFLSLLPTPLKKIIRNFYIKLS